MNTDILFSEKIIIFDNVIIGNNHVVINSSLINIAQLLFTKKAISKELILLGEESHSAILSELIYKNADAKISLIPIEVNQPSNGKVQKVVSWLKKLAEDQKSIGKLIAILQQREVKLILVSCMISFNLLFFFSRIRKIQERKFLVLVHGEVEYLFKKKLSFKEKINGYFLEKSFKKVPSNTRLIVFSDGLKTALLQKFNFSNDQVISINHPIQQFNRDNFGISNCISFSHIGVANKRKNSELIFKLADRFSDSIKKNKCKFSVIGRVEETEIPYISKNVVIESNGKGAIPNDNYKELISKSDYSLIFLPNDEYVYRVSGSLLDSIQFQVPIIALKHSFVTELFDKGGDIGFICEDFEEMLEVVNQICIKNPNYIDRYSKQVMNLNKLSKTFDHEKASKLINANLSSWEV